MAQRLLSVILAGCCAGAVAAATPGMSEGASAVSRATITVTTTDDEVVNDGDCSLREALSAANDNVAVDQCPAGSAGLDTIDLPAGTYTLWLTDAMGFGDLLATEDVSIVGAGAETTIIVGDTGFDSRILTASFSAPGSFSLAGVTVTGGVGGIALGSDVTATITDCVVDDNLQPAQGSKGGGIYTSGTLTLERVTISNNRASDGGGVACQDCDLTIRDSTICNNRADVYTNGGGSGEEYTSDGGGLWVRSYNDDPANATLENVTISGNVANYQGGGIFVDRYFWIYGPATVTLTNVTVTGNEADNNNDDTSEYAYGGGVYVGDAHLTAANCIFAANLEQDVLNDDPDCEAFHTDFTSNGYNLVGKDGGCDFDGPGDVTTSWSSAIDPGLAPLADNGGPTPTHALLFTSPAIDAGNPATPGGGSTSCLAEDQRGAVRPFYNACDIGAFEYQADDPTITLIETGDPDPDPALPGGSGASLREAIIAANSLPGAETIILPAATYTLTINGPSEDESFTGDLDIKAGLTLLGAGAETTFIDGGTSFDDRIFGINTSQTVRFEALSIRGGKPGYGGGGAMILNGGGLTEVVECVLRGHEAANGACFFVNNSQLSIVDSSLSSNHATGTAGAIYVHQSSDVEIRRSLIRSTSSDGDGGAITFDGANDGSLAITNSTISGCECVTNGGALNIVSASGSVDISSTTISNNRCDLARQGPPEGGGINNAGSATLTLRNSIIAKNYDGLSPTVGAPDVAGAITSAGYNLIGVLTAAATISGDTTGNLSGTSASPLSPGISNLAGNGGPTMTHALLETSPALDTANPSGCRDQDGTVLTVDQRGEVRPSGMACDMGSFELDTGMIFWDTFESGDTSRWLFATQ